MYITKKPCLSLKFTKKPIKDLIKTIANNIKLKSKMSKNWQLKLSK